MQDFKQGETYVAKRKWRIGAKEGDKVLLLSATGPLSFDTVTFDDDSGDGPFRTAVKVFRDNFEPAPVNTRNVMPKAGDVYVAVSSFQRVEYGRSGKINRGQEITVVGKTQDNKVMVKVDGVGITSVNLSTFLDVFEPVTYDIEDYATEYRGKKKKEASPEIVWEVMEDFALGRGVMAKKGWAAQGMRVEDGRVRFYVNAIPYKMSYEEFLRKFKPRKEGERMGAELYGYPPEEDTKPRTVTHEELRKRGANVQDNGKIAELERRVAEQQEKIKELSNAKEAERLRKVTEDYGVVEERHTWTASIRYPNFMGVRVDKDVAIITRDKSIAEAGIAAEAMAKGKHAKAEVSFLRYNGMYATLK